MFPPCVTKGACLKGENIFQKKSGKREEGAFQFFSLFDMESECIYMALPMCITSFWEKGGREGGKSFPLQPNAK